MSLNNRDIECNTKYESLANLMKSEGKVGIVFKKTKHKHEFQELCEELEPIYGKLVWTLPHKIGFTEYKIRKAHQIAQDRNILEFKYLVGIIKRLT